MNLAEKLIELTAKDYKFDILSIDKKDGINNVQISLYYKDIYDLLFISSHSTPSYKLNEDRILTILAELEIMIITTVNNRKKNIINECEHEKIEIPEKNWRVCTKCRVTPTIISFMDKVEINDN